MNTVLTKIVGRNVLSGYAIFFTRVVTAFFLTPFIIWSIGVSDYGLWLLILSVSGYFSLFDLGFGQAIIRFVAMKRATGERQALNELMSTFLLVYAAIGLVIMGATMALAVLFPSLFHITAEQAALSRFALLVAGFTVAVSFPLYIFAGLLNGYQRYDLTRMVEIVAAVFNVPLTIVVLIGGHGLTGLVLVSAAIVLASSLAQAVLARRLDPALEIRLKHFRLSRVREVMSHSIYFFVGGAAVQICHRSDQIVIGLFLPTTAVAIYGVSLRMVEMARMLGGQLNLVLFPVLAGLHALSDRAQIRNVLIEGTKVSVAIIVAIAAQMVVLGPPFINRWVGPDFLAGYPSLLVLLGVTVAAIGHDVASKSLLVSDRQRLVAAISAVDALANIGLSVLLVQRLGIVGVALGTAMPFAVAAATEVVVACRRLDLPVRQLVWLAFVPASLAALPAGLLVWGLREWIYPVAWWDMIWQASLGLALNAVGFIVLCMPARDRSLYLGFIGRRIGGLRLGQS